MIIGARLLGAFELTVDGRPVRASAFERPSGLRLLKLLLATPGHRIRRQAAAELLWPEAAPDRSAANLRKAVHFARCGLIAGGAAGGAVVADGQSLAIDAAATVKVDADELRAVVSATLAVDARDGTPVQAVLARLATLAGNDLLPDEPDEEWLLQLRERLHRDTVEALLFAADQARKVRAPELARRLVDAVLCLEPAEEAAHRLAIELHIEARRLDAARRQLLVCARALADAYDVAPSTELQAKIDAAQLAQRTGRPISADDGIGRMLVDALVEAVAAMRAVSPA